MEGTQIQPNTLMMEKKENGNIVEDGCNRNVSGLHQRDMWGADGCGSMSKLLTSKIKVRRLNR